MQFTVANTKTLLRELAPVGAVVPGRVSLPVLSHVLVEAHKQNGVRFTGTDLDVSVRRVLTDAKVEKPGRLCVPWKPLKNLLRDLPAKTPVRFTLEGKADLTVECGSVRVTLIGISAEEFPSWPKSVAEAKRQDDKIPAVHSVTLPAETLQACARVLPFASSEESRPILNGAMLEMMPSSVRGVATNGHRLMLVDLARGRDFQPANYELPKIPKGFEGIQLIFPTLAMDLFYALVADVTLTWQGNHAWLTEWKAGTLEIATRLIEGPYPNYRQILPRDNTRTLMVDRKALLGIVKRITKLASKETHRIVLETKEAGGELRVSATTPDLGTAGETLSASVQGNSQGLRWGMNGAYLTGILDALTGPTVQLDLYDGQNYMERAMLVTDPSDPSAQLIVMPIRLVD